MPVANKPKSLARIPFPDLPMPNRVLRKHASLLDTRPPTTVARQPIKQSIKPPAKPPAKPALPKAPKVIDPRPAEIEEVPYQLPPATAVESESVKDMGAIVEEPVDWENASR